jgi:cell volume regulation protein A
VHDLTSFGLTVLLVAGALSAALLASKVSARTSIPAAALFLVAAAAASDLFPSLVVSIGSVERVGTVALIVILFDGGSSIGLRRFRVAAFPIVSLGVLGARRS